MPRKLAFIASLALAAGACAQQPPAPAPSAQTRPASPAAAHSSSKTPERHISQQERDHARQDFLSGAKSLEHDDARAALESFTAAVRLDPGSTQYALSASIARQHLVMDLIQQSDKQQILGHFTQARELVRQASELDPSSPMVAQHAYQLASSTVAGEPALRIDDDLSAPVVLRPESALRSFHLRLPERELIQQVLAAYGIHPTLDNSVESRTVPFNVDSVGFDQAARALSLATGTFQVPLDPARVLVAKDTRENRTKFERVAAETVYLPGLSDQELSDIVTLARNVFGIQKAQTSAGHSALTVRAPAGDLTALNTTLSNLLDSRSELQLDVDMYEVDRTKAVDLGLMLPNQSSLFNVYSEARNLLNSNSSLVQQIVSSGLAAPGDWEAILAILIASGQVSNTLLTNPFGVFGGGLSMTGLTTSGGTLNMQLNSSDVHAVDHIQLRVLDHEEGIIRSGERYPIETSSYSSLSASSLSIPGISSAGLSSTLSNLGVNLSSLESAANEAIPQVQYEDIGLTLDVTPRIESPTSVSLKFDLKLSSLAGSSINGLPILDNREFQALTSLAPGQSAVLVSTLSRSESDAITGVPGLSEIPGFTDSTNKNTTVDYSRLAIVITPHIVRTAREETANRMILLPHNPQP